MAAAPDRTTVATVLLVEDNPPQVHLVEAILRDATTPIALHVVHDGAAAIDFVRQRGAFAGAARPDLVLLDLNLPEVDGRVVLATLKTDPALRTIPVVVLSASADPADVAACYAAGANAFVSKSVSLGDFFHSVRAIEAFWLRTATLPGRGPSDNATAGASAVPPPISRDRSG